MNGQHCETYDVIEREHFTVTREMLTAVARDQRWPGCFCFGLLYIKSH